MSWYDDVWNAIWSVLKFPFELVLKAVEAFASSAIKSIATNGGMVLMDAALEGVKALSESDKPGLEKFSDVFDRVTGTLEKEGIEFTTNAVRLAIEMAVAQLKEGEKPAEQPSPAGK